MLNIKDLAKFIANKIPRRRHLRGTFLHRAVGERLFHKECWQINRQSAAAGLAVGTLIAFTPTIGLQMVIAGTVAYFLRVNIPMALLACWFTNPVTVPIICPLQYKFGVWFLNLMSIEVFLVKQGGLFSNLVKYAWPLWIGSLISGIIASVLAYLSIYLAWDKLMNLKGKLDSKLHNISGNLEDKLQQLSEEKNKLPKPKRKEH